MSVVFSESDRQVIRRLAGDVREVSQRPINENRRDRWYRHNSLMPGLPMVLCSPEGSWPELLPETALECKDPLLRGWEYQLRELLVHADFLEDDHVIEPHFEIPWIIDGGTYGVSNPKTQGENRGSYVWDPPIQDIGRDLQKLRFREPSVDREATDSRLNLAGELFGDLLDIRIGGQYWWTMGLTWPAVELIGLEQLMWAMVDCPDDLHRLMAWLRDEHENFILWFEKEGLLTTNCREQGIASGGIGFTDELPVPANGQPAMLSQLWGFAESQETVGISPEMFEEFVLPYQRPLLDRFGLNCYGCCEPLHNRWKQVRTLPRLRRVSVSPWCDMEIMAEELKRDYIFSRKPNPSLVCVDFDEENVRADLRQTLAIAGDCVLEIILKDTHTVQNQPERLRRWVQIAREEIDRHYGNS